MQHLFQLLKSIFHGLVVVVVFTTAIFLISLSFSGQMSSEQIMLSHWKSAAGAHFGDRLDFGPHNLRGDTIFRAGKPVGLISYCGKQWVRRTAILEIKDYQTGKLGLYHQK